MDEKTTYVAFAKDRLLRSGALTEVLAAVKLSASDPNAGGILMFDCTSGQQVDFDMRGSLDDVLERLRAQRTTKGPGRPRLGVESREVGLLPRHWQWLESQPSGISAALRKLVEEHMRHVSPEEQARRRTEATYKIMSALAGNKVNFEEAARALFAGETGRFEKLIKGWPGDIKRYLKQRCD